MKRIAMIAAVAAFALASTSAMAGGFKYGSAGGNFGKWAYGDGAAGGDAKIVGLGYGETSSESYAGSQTNKSFGYGGYGTSAMAESGNRSSFKGLGVGYAQSGSSAVAGSGIGHGFGFKVGGVGGGHH